MSLAQTLGMTADDVYQAYLKKNQVNHARQDSGYVKKDEAGSEARLSARDGGARPLPSNKLAGRRPCHSLA